MLEIKNGQKDTRKQERQNIQKKKQKNSKKQQKKQQQQQQQKQKQHKNNRKTTEKQQQNNNKTTKNIRPKNKFTCTETNKARTNRIKICRAYQIATLITTTQV